MSGDFSEKIFRLMVCMYYIIVHRSVQCFYVFSRMFAAMDGSCATNTKQTCARHDNSPMGLYCTETRLVYFVIVVSKEIIIGQQFGKITYTRGARQVARC